MPSDILDSLAKKSDEHEFYTPVPASYKVGRTKYIITTGTVISGLGKGIFGSSLAKLLKFKGLNVTQIKMEGYFNIDSGTLNPYRHGEVFVLDDGMECDMDLGSYERFLDQNLTRDNFITSGQVFSKVLSKERGGSYLGRDVQFIPHVTGEVKSILRELAVKTKADVIIVEIGGTVGDLENAYYLEATRQLMYEEGKENVCFATLTYVITPASLGEQKSKAAQLGINRLIALGIHPDIIGCRADAKVTEKAREKISIYSNVPFERVFSLHNVKNIYEIPLLLKDAKIDDAVVDLLKLNDKVDKKKESAELKKWAEYVNKFENAKKEITIGITGKYTEIRDSYASITESLNHAGTEFNTRINIKWIETTKIENGASIAQELKGVSGIIVPGGFGSRGIEGKIKCVEYARKNKLPFLGLCLGFQMAVIEFGRNVCGIKNANSTEMDPKTPEPIVDILPEQKKIEGLGGNQRLGARDIEVKKATKAYELYGKKEIIRERFRHRWECNPKYIKTLEAKGMVFSGKAPNVPIMQILELKGHPFFMASQFHPEFTSRPMKPNPLFYGFIQAAIKNS